MLFLNFPFLIWRFSGALLLIFVLHPPADHHETGGRNMYRVVFVSENACSSSFLSLI